MVGTGHLVKQGHRYYAGTPTSEATALGFKDEVGETEQVINESEAAS
jgi:hypothetical protein